MPHVLSGPGKVFAFCLLPLLVSTACLISGPGAPASTPTAPAATTASPAAVTTTAVAPASTSTPAATATPAGLVFGPGPLVITDTAAGLAHLASYTGTLIYAFDGTRDGQPERWSKTYVMQVRRDPAARQLTITTTGTVSATDAIFMLEVDGVAYQRQGQADCAANVLAPGDSPAAWLEPSGILGSVIGADKAGSETVNGVPAVHYTFDERALGAQGIAQSNGELWVAAQGGFLVKYSLTSQGDAKLFGQGLAGTLTWDYELTGANQPLALAVPPDCPLGLVPAPRLPDAAHVHNLPGLLTYDTASSLADAAAFYQQQLPGLGWTPLNAPSINDSSALLDYIQAGQTLTLVLTASAGGTNVALSLDRAAP
jgi:hypothetical protein